MDDLLDFLKLIPVLFELVKSIKKFIAEEKLETTLEKHVQTVDDAFKTKNATELNALFNKRTTT